MSMSLGEQLKRRKPIVFRQMHHEGEELARNLTTFQLMMFGVGATVGTGIFFVLSESVPEAGPAVIISFLIAGLAAGLSALCYAELASAIPVCSIEIRIDSSPIPASACCSAPSSAGARRTLPLSKRKSISRTPSGRTR